MVAATNGFGCKQSVFVIVFVIITLFSVLLRLKHTFLL